MAIKSPVCPKCGRGTFEINTLKLEGAQYLNSLVQCQSCGVVVGALSATDAGVLVKDALKELAEVKTQLARLEGVVATSLQQRSK